MERGNLTRLPPPSPLWWRGRTKIGDVRRWSGPPPPTPSSLRGVPARPRMGTGSAYEGGLGRRKKRRGLSTSPLWALGYCGWLAPVSEFDHGAVTLAGVDY